MVERLQHALDHIDQLPNDVQEDLAEQIEELTDLYVLPPTIAQRMAEAQRLAGIWSDLPWEEMEQELDRIRHANPPSPPLDL